MPTVEQIMEHVCGFAKYTARDDAIPAAIEYRKQELRSMIQQAVRAPIRTAERLPEGMDQDEVIAWSDMKKKWGRFYIVHLRIFPKIYTHWLPSPTPPQE